jgi:hypothetical protein
MDYRQTLFSCQRTNVLSYREAVSFNDPQKTTRQQVYIRALKAYIPEIEIYYGHFLSNPIRAPLVTPTSGQKFADVIKTEEKGSDVNLNVA